MILSYYKKIICFFVLALMIVFFQPFFAYAKNKALLDNIKLANTRDDLVVYFDVQKAFTQKIRQAILNGIKTTFVFNIKLYKTDDSWFKDKVSEIKIESTIKYNSLKKEFSVIRLWKKETPNIVQSFEKAQELMTEIDNLKLVSLKKLIKKNKYQLHIKADLDKITLPLSLHHVFFFLSFWNVETNWFIVNFIY